jgi:hypothetical protein
MTDRTFDPEEMRIRDERRARFEDERARGRRRP